MREWGDTVGRFSHLFVPRFFFSKFVRGLSTMRMCVSVWCTCVYMEVGKEESLEIGGRGMTSSLRGNQMHGKCDVFLSCVKSPFILYLSIYFLATCLYISYQSYYVCPYFFHEGNSFKNSHD